MVRTQVVMGTDEYLWVPMGKYGHGSLSVPIGTYGYLWILICTFYFQGEILKIDSSENTLPTEVPKKMNKEELQKLVSKALENSKRKVHKLIKHIGLFFRTN